MAINVMIVDDSILMRVLLKDIIESISEEGVRVVASVSNGCEALKHIRSNPDIDLVTLDIEMPEKNGLETLREMMQIRRVPVLMISSLTHKGANETIEALSYGAVDFITKIDDEQSNGLMSIKEEIQKKVLVVAKSKPTRVPPKFINSSLSFSGDVKHIVGLGSSTGGPGALRVFLSSITKDFSSPIIIAQHMPKGGFIESLADNLNQNSLYRVKVVENGEKIEKSTAYLCPAGCSVEVFKRGRHLHLVLTNKDITVYRPSVNTLFSSISKLDSSIKKSGIVLTGMGDDGMLGSRAIYQKGGTIFAESEETSIVYGMPKKVTEQGIEVVVADIDKLFYQLKKKTLEKR